MNIIIVNHYAGSLNHGMEYRPYYLAREWVNLGHDVIIIASSFSHLRKINPVIREQQNYFSETIDKIKYIWCKTPTYSGNGLGRLLNILSFLYRLHNINLFDKADLVISSSTYPFDIIFAKRIARKNNAKLIYEVHDLWPLSLIELHNMKKYNPFIWLMQKCENYAYRNADKVVSLLPKSSTYMQEHGMQVEKFVYVPNGAEISLKDNIDISTIFKEEINRIKTSYKFIVGYAGSIGEANQLEELIKVCDDEYIKKNIAFIILGDGPNKNSLIKMVVANKLNNIFFYDSISKNQVQGFLAMIDIAYLGWKKLSIYRFGICPNKIFEYMLARNPIINACEAGNDIVKDANCGLTVKPENSQEIAGAIKTLVKLDKDKLNQLGNNGYNYLVKFHNYQILARQFIEGCL